MARPPIIPTPRIDLPSTRTPLAVWTATRREIEAIEVNTPEAREAVTAALETVDAVIAAKTENAEAAE